MITIAATTSSSGSRPAVPSRGAVADGDLGDVLDGHRNAVLLGQDDVLDVVDVITLGQMAQPRRHSIRPTPRKFTDCCPILMVRPPTLILALPMAAVIWGSVTL